MGQSPQGGRRTLTAQGVETKSVTRTRRRKGPVPQDHQITFNSPPGGEGRSDLTSPR